MIEYTDDEIENPTYEIIAVMTRPLTPEHQLTKVEMIKEENKVFVLIHTEGAAYIQKLEVSQVLRRAFEKRDWKCFEKLRGLKSTIKSDHRE
ncbi:MAG: hypothetical protein ACXQT2_01495 [Methanotrichaceae archaeon]